MENTEKSSATLLVADFSATSVAYSQLQILLHSRSVLWIRVCAVNLNFTYWLVIFYGCKI